MGVGTVNRLFLPAWYLQPHHILIRYTTHLASTEIWPIQSNWQPLVLIQGSWMNQWMACIQSMVISFIVSFIQTIATPNYNSFRYYIIISCSVGLPSWKHRWVHGANIRLFFYNEDYFMILYCVDAYCVDCANCLCLARNLITETSLVRTGGKYLSLPIYQYSVIVVVSGYDTVESFSYRRF